MKRPAAELGGKLGHNRADARHALPSYRRLVAGRRPAFACFAQAPAASQPVLPAIKTPAAVANPYGLQAMWSQGDWVARITILILAIMSLASWYVLISKLVAQSRMGGQARAANASLLEGRHRAAGRRDRCRRAAPTATSPNRRWKARASTMA